MTMCSLNWKKKLRKEMPRLRGLQKPVMDYRET